MVLECGTDSPWICPLLEDMGHEVILANPRQLPLISKSLKKTDSSDAETLARMGRADPKLLSPVKPRSPEVPRSSRTWPSSMLAINWCG